MVSYPRVTQGGYSDWAWWHRWGERTNRYRQNSGCLECREGIAFDDKWLDVYYDATALRQNLKVWKTSWFRFSFAAVPQLLLPPRLLVSRMPWSKVAIMLYKGEQEVSCWKVVPGTLFCLYKYICCFNFLFQLLPFAIHSGVGAPTHLLPVVSTVSCAAPSWPDWHARDGSLLRNCAGRGARWFQRRLLKLSFDDLLQHWRILRPPSRLVIVKIRLLKIREMRVKKYALLLRKVRHSFPGIPSNLFHNDSRSSPN